MKYAHIDKDSGMLLGWYADDVHDMSKIPTPNIEVPDDVWQQAIEINANCYYNGSFIDKDLRSTDELEADRIRFIKETANEIIVAKYSLIWQLNHPRLDSRYTAEYLWIDSIRYISNNAELLGTNLDDINWEV